MLDKPVPCLDPIITKIMDVVWIEDVVEYEKLIENLFKQPLFRKGWKN